jgi:hypothetical protein
MKRLLVAAIMVLCFFSLAMADSFCEENYGIPFFSDRNLAEAQMTKNFGKSSLKNDSFTVWMDKNKNSSMSLFFKQDKLVGASTMVSVVADTTEIVKETTKIFIEMKQLLDKEESYQFIKEISMDFSGLKSKGFLYKCKRNSMERMVIYISKDPKNQLLGVTLHSYLTGFGMREFD